MTTDKFDIVLARADRVMAQVDERIGSGRAGAMRERERLMGGYGRSLVRATMIAGGIVLGAMVVGLVTPIGIIGFVGAVAIAIAAFMAIFLGGVVGTKTAPKVPTDVANGEMVDRFDSYIFRVRRALPASAQAEVDRIGATLAPLKATLSRIDDIDPGAQDARRLLSVHLPGLIDRYLHVPSAYRGETDSEGKSVDQRLVDALGAGREALGEIGERLARADIAALETQGRFIEQRYKEPTVE